MASKEEKGGARKAGKDILKKLIDESVFNDLHSVKDITKPKYRHALLMLYWLVDFPSYFLIQKSVKKYAIIHCALDDMIPFLEIFSVPYVLWFPFYIGTLLYTMLYDPPAFKRGMHSFMVTFTITKLIFAFLPNGVDLRPDPLPRKNIFIRLVKFLYGSDRSMNCCPSEHVLGSVLAVMMAFDSKKLSNPKVRAGYVIMCTLICLSTFHIKQHSVLDAIACAPLALLAWFLFYRKKKQKEEKKDPETEEEPCLN